MRKSIVQLPPLVLNEVSEALDPYEEESPDTTKMKRSARKFRIVTQKIKMDNSAKLVTLFDQKPKNRSVAVTAKLTSNKPQSSYRSREVLKSVLSRKTQASSMSEASYATESLPTTRTISTAGTSSSNRDTTSAVTPDYQLQRPASRRDYSQQVRPTRPTLHTTHTRFPRIACLRQSVDFIVSPTARLDTAARQIRDFSQEAMSDCASILADAEFQMQSLNVQITALKSKTEGVIDKTEAQRKEFFEQRFKRQLRQQRDAFRFNPQYCEDQICFEL